MLEWFFLYIVLQYFLLKRFYLFIFLLLKYILLIMLLKLSQFFSPLFPSTLYPISHHHSPNLVHVHGSYIQVIWLLYFPYQSLPSPVYFVPTIYASYSLYPVPHSPISPSLLITLHVISICVNLFPFQFAQFVFVFFFFF